MGSKIKKGKKKIVTIDICLPRDIISYIIMVIQVVVLFLNWDLLRYVLEIVALLILIILYINDLIIIVEQLKRKFTNR